MKVTYVAAMLAGVSSLTISVAASAQEAADADGVSVDNEIIVSARRRDESLQDVPQVVNAVTGDALQDLNIKKFEDIATVVPGLTLTGSNTGTSSAMSLRGVTFDSFGSAPPTVAFYMNEAPVFNTFVFQSMFDIGQIEVLRGPQGTLRGRSAPSGSITITTKRPDLNEVGGTINGSATTKDAYNLNGAISIPLIQDKLAIRLAGIVDDSKADFVRSVNSNVKPHSETQAGRISLRAEPIDAISVNVMYQKLDRDQQSTRQVESTSLSRPGIPAGTGPIIRASDRLGIDNVPARLSEVQEIFTAQGAFRFAGQKLEYVYGLTNWNTLTTTSADEGYVFPALQLTQDVDTDFKAESHEVRLSSDERIMGMFDYTVGYFHFTNKSLNDVNSAGIFAIPGFGNFPSTTATDYTQKRKEEAFFGNITAHIGESTEISAGVRHIKARDADLAVVTVRAPGLGVNQVVPLVDLTRKYSKTIYNISVSHRLSDGFMVYANHGSAFRPGPATLGVTSLRTSNLTKYLNLAPESSKSYEIGFKSTLLDRRLRVNAAYFHQDFSGYLYRGTLVPYVNVTAGPVPGTTNEAVGNFRFQANVPAKVDGFEVEVQYSPSERFNLNASFAYAKGKITGGEIPCNPVAGAPTVAQIKAASGGGDIAVCKVTQRLSFAPNWTLVLQPEYNVPVSDTANAFVRGLFTLYPDNPNVPTNPFDAIKSYSVSNLYLGLRDPDGAWEVSLFGKNIFKTGRTLTRGDLQPLTNLGPGGSTFNAAYGSYVPVTYTPPREFGVNLRMAFGSR